MKQLQTVVGRIYHLLTKEAAYGPNLRHLDDFRAAKKLEMSLDDGLRDKEQSGVGRSGGRVASRDGVQVGLSRKLGGNGDGLSGRR
ncbi:hypothetical protein [Bradyrhizobium sp. CB2312]|uniref:hypothetical protein n=1 Tax=Bradyrhizobium sp. CB2312 TaxID=3039155 RepID=UPI0024B15C8B|nr:hypothetical protein [Bradyrhizobium sp. CB2312]WFU75482.1 hypothetical protein QA642_16435 [Bradyrhizobium sp. CB2312]